MNIKAVVKVMNFHALLRVDSSRKKADAYRQLESELSTMIDIIINNKNFILDKKIMTPNPNNPKLYIYFGSDYGFCGSINSTINGELMKNLRTSDAEMDTITVGKKLRKQDDILFHVTRDNFEKIYQGIYEVLEDAVKKLEYSQIFLVYNHYHNMTTIEPVTKCIFPMEIKKSGSKRYAGDFAVEGDAAKMLERLMISYLNYEVKIAFVNSYAAENIIRQNATSQSLKKLDEKEEEQVAEDRKIKNQKSFRKVIDSYMKKKSLGGTR